MWKSFIWSYWALYKRNEVFDISIPKKDLPKDISVTFDYPNEKDSDSRVSREKYEGKFQDKWTAARIPEKNQQFKRLFPIPDPLSLGVSIANLAVVTSTLGVISAAYDLQ